MTDHESSDEVIRRNRAAVKKSQDDYHKKRLQAHGMQAPEQAVEETVEEDTGSTPVAGSEVHSSQSQPSHAVDLEPDPEVEDDLNSVHSGSHGSSTASEAVTFAGSPAFVPAANQQFRQLEERYNVPESVRIRNRQREARAQTRRDQEQGLAPVAEDTVSTDGPLRGADLVSPTVEEPPRPVGRRSASVDVRLQHGGTIPSGPDSDYAPRTGHRQHPSRQIAGRQSGQSVRAPEPEAERPPRNWDYDERGSSNSARLLNEANSRRLAQNRSVEENMLAAIRGIETQVLFDVREEEDRLRGRHRGESHWEWENRVERDARNQTHDWNQDASVAIARRRPTHPAQSWQDWNDDDPAQQRDPDPTPLPVSDNHQRYGEDYEDFWDRMRITHADAIAAYKGKGKFSSAGIWCEKGTGKQQSQPPQQQQQQQTRSAPPPVEWDSRSPRDAQRSWESDMEFRARCRRQREEDEEDRKGKGKGMQAPSGKGKQQQQQPDRRSGRNPGQSWQGRDWNRGGWWRDGNW